MPLLGTCRGPRPTSSRPRARLKHISTMRLALNPLKSAIQSYSCDTWSIQLTFLGGRQSLPSSAPQSGHDTHHNGNLTRGYSQSLTSESSLHLSGLKTNTWDLSPRQSTPIPPTTTKSLITNTRSWTRSAAVLPRLNACEHIYPTRASILSKYSPRTVINRFSINGPHESHICVVHQSPPSNHRTRLQRMGRWI
jgi:hypothetical protein